MSFRDLVYLPRPDSMRTIFDGANEPHRDLHARLLDAFIASDDWRIAQALRILEYVQARAILNWRLSWDYLDGVQREWTQAVDLPPIVAEVRDLVWRERWVSPPMVPINAHLRDSDDEESD